MPQLITRYNQVWEHPLLTSAPQDIPGMSVTLLIGSGWITVHFIASFFNSDDASFQVNLNLLLDDLPVYPSQGGSSTVSAPSYATAQLHLRAALRPGAGTHTFKIQAQGPIANTKIHGSSAFMTVLEHGF